MKHVLFFILNFILVTNLALAANKKTAVESDMDVNDVTTTKGAGKAIKSSTEPSVFSRVIPEVSLLVSTFTGSSTAGLSNRTGLGFGLLTDMGRTDLVFETGFMYRQVGATGSSGDIKYAINFNYISIPIAGKYYINGRDNNTVYIKMGMMPSFMASKEVTATKGSETASSSDLRVNSFDFGILGGIGGKISMNEKAAMIVEANYVKGLTNLSDGGDVYNSSVTFMAGLGFDL